MFVAHHQTPKNLQPTIGSLDCPPPTEATQLATVLQRWTTAVLAVGADQIDAAVRQPLPERVITLFGERFNGMYNLPAFVTATTARG